MYSVTQTLKISWCANSMQLDICTFLKRLDKNKGTYLWPKVNSKRSGIKTKQMWVQSLIAVLKCDPGQTTKPL